MNTMSTDKSIIPLLAVIATVSAPLLFILGIAFGANFRNADSLIGGSISDWLTAGATVSVTALTFVLAKESWQLRLLQLSQIKELQIESIRPDISVHFESNKTHASLLSIKILNSGKGVARNVKFSFLKGTRELTKPNEDPIVDRLLKLGFLRNGIKALGATQTISSFAINAYEINQATEGKFLEQSITLAVDFQDGLGNKYKIDYPIDFSEMDGVVHFEKNPLHKISDDIGAIKNCIERSVKSSTGRIGVNIYDTNDRSREAENLQNLVEKRRAETMKHDAQDNE